MNLHYLLQRLRGKATCNLGPRAKLSASALIYNIRGHNDFINIGADSLIAGELLCFRHAGSISIGQWCYVGKGAYIWSAASIIIGDRVLISHNVNIFDSLTHPINRKQRHEHFKTIAQVGHPAELVGLDEKPVVIENDVWIGANAIILRGVHVGEGAIIGAGSVVTRDVPKFTVIAGNPARVIRELRDDER